jgi:CxxC-x17-CxxC domain-containing protein
MSNLNKILDREKRNSTRPGDFKKKKSDRKEFRNRERPQMYEAICSDCGKRCEVPFKPTGDKPIYCSQCFTNHGGASRFENRSERGRDERNPRQNRPMFDAICDTCGKKFELPFKPTKEKPVYCNECFGKRDSSNKNVSAPVNQNKEQFEILNAKIDKILKLLTPVVPVKEEKKEIIVKKNKETTKKKITKKEKPKKPKKVVVKKPAVKKKSKK